MPRLVDRMAALLHDMVYVQSIFGEPGKFYRRPNSPPYSMTKEAEELLIEYNAMRERRAQEAKLTEEDLTDEDEPSDYTALSPDYSKLPENFDEWGQGYGRCPTCGMPWDIVRPGKGQPACDCSYNFYHPLQSLPVENEHG